MKLVAEHTVSRHNAEHTVFAAQHAVDGISRHVIAWRGAFLEELRNIAFVLRGLQVKFTGNYFATSTIHRSNARSQSDAVTAAMALMPEGSVDEGHADEFQKSHARQEGTALPQCATHDGPQKVQLAGPRPAATREGRSPQANASSSWPCVWQA